jgi:hypothetical protein
MLLNVLLAGMMIRDGRSFHSCDVHVSRAAGHSYCCLKTSGTTYPTRFLFPLLYMQTYALNTCIIYT